MPRLKITVAYDGTEYAGWQVQRGQPTIQSTLQDAFEQIQLGRLDITGASRTDAGVHATAQVFHVDVPEAVEPDRLLGSLNGVLPRNIRLADAQRVPDNFHARYDATAKSYQYLLALGRVAPPLLRHAVWHHPAQVDPVSISAAAGVIVGTHDFAAFQAAGSDVEDTRRTVHSASFAQVELPGLSPDEAQLWAFRISGDGFLYKMIRSIVGTLMEIGRNRSEPTVMEGLLSSGDREAVGATAPAHGLTLCEVRYAEP